MVRPERLRAEILYATLDLRDEPRPPNSELQYALHDRYRLKINGWRVFYKIDDDDKVVTVLEVRSRNRNTYLNVP
ncbi:MAG: type II toxin-antitoxin system RelE/ParE family toxin [Chloroflexota bacterium]